MLIRSCLGTAGTAGQSRRRPSRGGSVLLVMLALAVGPACATAQGNAAIGWGSNYFLETGAGFKSDIEESPVASLGGVANIASVSSSDSFGYALLRDGTVISWGGNVHGQLGDSSHLSLWEKQTAPGSVAPAGLSHVQVMTVDKRTGAVIPLTEVSAVSASGGHGIALLKDGTVMAWGNNEYGADGKGELNPNAVLNPKTGKVEGMMAGTSPSTAQSVEWKEGGRTRKLEHVVAISTGPRASGSYAVVKDPTTGVTLLYAWGRNDAQQLGLGSRGEEGGPEECNSAELGLVRCSTKPRPVELPRSVTSGAKHIVAVTGGVGYAVALLDDGTALSWGSNGAGQLGAEVVPSTGTDNGRNHPEPVEGLAEATALAAGGNSTLALLRSGAVVGWGANGNGQLGEERGQRGEGGEQECGKTVCRKLPQPIRWKDAAGTHELSGVSAIAEGYGYSLVAREGELVSFGSNRYGSLGLGSGGANETCRDEKAIIGETGSELNALDNHARCHGPEECVSVLEGNVDPRGAWAASTEYGYGDIVEESGASYVSINVSNQGHKPGRSPTSWLAVGGSTGEKVREEEGTPCGRSPHQVQGIGPVASISAGAKHAVAVLQRGVAAPPPTITLTQGSGSLTVSWRVPARKAEYRVRAGLLKGAAIGFGPTYTYLLKPLSDEERSFAFPGLEESSPLQTQPYVVQVRTCWPECLGTDPESQRLIAGTPTPPP